MPYVSSWKITLAPGEAGERVLVDIGGRIGEELRFPWQQQVDEGRHFRADGRRRWGRGNVSGGLTVQVLDSHASHAAAQAWMLQLQLDLASYSKTVTTLEVETSGGATYVLANAVLSDADSSMMTSGRTVTTYKISGGTWSLGTPAGPDPVGLDAAALSLSRNFALADAGGAAPDHLEAIATWANGGTGGDASQATSGNRPAALVGSGMYLPGISGNYYSIASTAGLAAGSNFAVRVDVELPDYTPAARSCLACKWDTAGNRRSWALYLETDGKVTLAVSTDGTSGTVTEWTSALPLGLSAGDFAGILVVKNLTALSFTLYPTTGWSNGITFSPQQTISNLAAYTTTSAVEIGSTSAGTADLLSGHVHRMQFWTAPPAATDSALLLVDFVGGNSTLPSAVTVARSGTNPLRFHFRAGSTPGPGSYPRFDGSNDSMALADPVPLNAVSGVTVAWLGLLSRVTGDNDLIYCGTNSTDPRVLLRVDDGDVKLLVRRTDAEATATITAAGAVAVHHDGSISASVDYAAGTGTIYVNGNPVATGALTSAGTTSATDSSETRIMAGQGGANPAAGDVRHALILEEASGPFAMQQWLASMAAAS